MPEDISEKLINQSQRNKIQKLTKQVYQRKNRLSIKLLYCLYECISNKSRNKYRNILTNKYGRYEICVF